MRINSGRRVSGLTVIRKSLTCSVPEQRTMNKKPVAIELKLSIGHRFFYLLFSLQTIRFHHQPYPDFHPLLKCAFLPRTAHASLPDHNLLPERDLTSNIVLYQSIHARYLSHPRFKLFFFRLRCSPRHCSLRCYRITLCVSLIDQVEQVFHRWIILRRRSVDVVFQNLFQVL